MSSTPSPSDSPVRSGSSRGRAAVAVTAVVLAAVSVISLAIVLAGDTGGRHVWDGFVWIAMCGLPVAFVLLCILVIGNIRRRRSL